MSRILNETKLCGFCKMFCHEVKPFSNRNCHTTCLYNICEVTNSSHHFLLVCSEAMHPHDCYHFGCNNCYAFQYQTLRLRGPFHKSSYERFLLYEFVEPVLNYMSNEFVDLTNLCETRP